ncbi:hypothetical protein T02_13905 [Trichinella nativa]|uniref:PiggyBac transposable element-derived protein domain-containing protein n=1 Tax=Trichinella nativa TaxID=6335 RepID=A0A0V1KJA0_9BILA|nr:hypothetical protein T02_13905 [Trichinella nativa]
MPNIVRSYNTGMGGVDLLAAAYRPTIRSEKWYWPFEHCYSGCLVDSLLRGIKTTQPLRAPSTSSPELDAVKTNSDTKSGIRFNVTIA